ncbi:MAG: hypothetical protein GY716_16855 [bacterium]|nr:hypothetical protein [bacterium]
MYRGVTGMIFGLLLVSGCGAPVRESPELVVAVPTRAPDPSRPCEIPIAEQAELSPIEECWMAHLKRRCDQDDVCLVDCFANSKHRRRVGDRVSRVIGGGCWHVCFAYSGIEWTEPEGWEECDGLDSELPSRR